MLTKFEKFNYSEYHGHDKIDYPSILWYFHNGEHGYKHCKGGKLNPYKVTHYKNYHGIDKKYARGHGWG